MARPLPSLLIAALVLSCTFGCAAGSEDDHKTATSYETLDGFCEARGKVECNELVVKSCGAKDAVACVAARKKACIAEAPQGASYTVAGAGGCITVAKAAYQDGKLTTDELDDLQNACGTKVFSGPGAARAPCTSDYDCKTADGLRCVTPTGATASKCLKPNTVDLGGSCESEADLCTKEAFCDSKSHACTTRAPVGAQCQVGTCARGLFCVTSPFNSGCRAKLQEGEACNKDADCGSELCARWVGAPSGSCVAALEFSASLAQCASFK